jgi:tRNA (uracil-5-)-methyltransferase TRM9
MNLSTRARLLQLNRNFYDQFAAEFSASRATLTPGILRALRALEGSRSLLDLGCGDGRIEKALVSGVIPNQVLRYVGVDFSAGLLRLRSTGRADIDPQDAAGVDPQGAAGADPHGAARADPHDAPARIDCRFALADLSSSDWSDEAGLGAERFHAITCFAALFHIPGHEDRARLLRQIRERLSPGGKAAISIWRFLHLLSLRDKIVPWGEDRGILASEVDPGDYLIDWRRGGTGLRYVHHFEDDELDQLLLSAGLRIVERYRSDGRTGDLSLFIIVQPA